MMSDADELPSGWEMDGADEEVLRPEDYMKQATPKSKSHRGRKLDYKPRFADPADDPAPLGDDSFDPQTFIDKMAGLIEAEVWDMAELEGMKYALACVKAKGDMLAEDDPARARNYRYFQVTPANWQETVARLGYPEVPNMPSHLAIATGTARGSRKRNGGPEFIIVADEAPETTTKGAALYTTASEEEKARIAEAEAQLPPRPPGW